MNTNNVECKRYRLQPKFHNNKFTFNAIKERLLIKGHAIDPTLIRVDNTDYLFVSSSYYWSVAS